MNKISSFDEAVNYIYSYIKHGDIESSSAHIDRTRALLNELGNPHHKLNAIHIAGTSGKGSTSYLISTLLLSQGFSTGLYTSPHLFDIRERIKINNEYISKEKFISYLNEIIPSIEKINEMFSNKLNYFEVLVVLSFYIFNKEGVKYAVIETGLGGLNDSTNVLDNKVSVITRIGLDHVDKLGSTLSEIASHKAGIIKHGNDVIALFQSNEINKIIEKSAAKYDANISFVKENVNFSNLSVERDKSTFDYSFNEFNFKGISLGLIGAFQIENCSIALSAFLLISKRDNFVLNESKMRESLKIAHLDGRFDIVSIKGKKVILDGAHNGQKIDAFIGSLKTIFPDTKFDFLIDYKINFINSFLKTISPVADLIVLTKFYEEMKNKERFSAKVKDLKDNLNLDKSFNYKIIVDYNEAMKELLGKPDSILVVTGSIYLIGKIYKDYLKNS